jgi:Zn-dependent protease
MADIPATSSPGDPPEAPPAPPSDTARFEAAWDDNLYQQTCTQLEQPEATGSTRSAWLWMFLTLGLFALSMLGTFAQKLGTVLVVLLLHESGHFLGMRLFGYRNVRMFFIPFFGAAVSGSKHAAPAWQQGIVLLLGPLPGIALAAVLTATLGLSAQQLLGDAALWLVVINGFNLLPLVPLDGGRLLDVLLCWGRPRLAVALQVLAAGGLGALAWLERSGVLWGITVLLLLTAAARARKARLERLFGDNPLQMPARFEELSTEHRRELFTYAVLLNPLSRTPASIALAVRDLHERTVSRPPQVWVAAVLFALYLAGWAAGGWTLYALRQNTQHQEQPSKTAQVLLRTPPRLAGACLRNSRRLPSCSGSSWNPAASNMAGTPVQANAAGIGLPSSAGVTG